MQSNLDRLDHLLPSGPQEDKLIVDLQSGADLWAMGFLLVRFGDRAEMNGFKEMPMTIGFDGSYHDLLNLLDYLRVYERAVRVDEIKMAPGRDKANMLSINMKASAFYSD